MSADHYVCIHGHFYQPPRENPWLETIDYQESAKPFHDWNERISAECYRSNGLSRILDDDGWVAKLSNNYSRISFNFGPTLLSWMEEHDPQAYAAVLEGDRLSRERFGGHGSALAQAYNHTILPLANRRDKITQIKWGLYDFEKRFGRAAEAMWIPETAVDLETLEIMADHGLKFVILAPRQAQAVRPLEGEHLWESVRGEKINTRVPYRINLPNGGSIAAFFYNGDLSRAVAFEGLLNNGESFANALCSRFDHLTRPQLTHIATDGESYGHHHLHGDMALAYALDHIERKELAILTNYGQFLELFPPTHEAMIYEKSSWSCIHGIERWNSDCGCNSGGRRDWHQKWRRPLRESMDYLRDELTPCFEEVMSTLVEDPWAMRDDYISIILDRSDDNRAAFLKRWLRSPESAKDQEEILFKALEMQRNLMLMYTSCAWFFDEISGVETVQALEYSAKAIELAQDVCDADVETEFLRILQTAPSNLPDFDNGRYVFELFVWPARMDFLKVATHLGAQALFQNLQSESMFACFDINWVEVGRFYSGRAQLMVAHIKITSRVTREERDIEFVAVHLGDHNMNIGTLPFSGDKSYAAMTKEFSETFTRGDLAKSLRLLDKYFEGNIYYLNDLFHDQQKEIIDHVFSQTLEGLEDQFNTIYDQHYSVMSYLSNIQIALPQVFSHIAHFVQNKHIKNQLRADTVGIEEIERYVQEAKSWNVELDRAQIERLYVEALKRALSDWQADADDPEKFRNFQRLVELKTVFPFEPDIGEIQNLFAQWHHRQPRGRNAEWVDIAAALKVHLEERLFHAA